MSVSLYFGQWYFRVSWMEVGYRVRRGCINGWHGIEWLTVTKLRKRYIYRVGTLRIIRFRTNGFQNSRIIKVVDICLWWEGSRARLADIVGIEIWVVGGETAIDGVALLLCVVTLRCLFCGGVAGQESGQAGGGVVRHVGVGDGGVDEGVVCVVDAKGYVFSFLDYRVVPSIGSILVYFCWLGSLLVLSGM